MRKILNVLVIAIFCAEIQLPAQDRKLVDSLKGRLAFVKPDTLKVNLMIRLASIFNSDNQDSSIVFANKALALAKTAGYKKGISDALNEMGIYHENKGDYIKALEMYRSALVIREEIGAIPKIARSYNNIGQAYARLGNYPEALKNFFSSLKKYEEIKDDIGIAMLYSNIGNIYWYQNNYRDALINHQYALDIFRKAGDKFCIAGSYNNMGIIYSRQEKNQDALNCYYAALLIFREIDNKYGTSIMLNNIGLLNLKQKQYQEAFKNFDASLKISEEINDKAGIAIAYCNIGKVLTFEYKFSDAYKYLDKSLLLSKESGSLETLKETYGNLSELDSSCGNYKDALTHYKLYVQFRDSLFNKENTKKSLQQQMQYAFDKREAVSKAEQEKKIAINQKELQRQKGLRNVFIAGFLVVLIFAVIILKQRGKIIHEKKNSDLQKKRSDDLLLNILPGAVADELKQTGTARVKTYSLVTVMFADFVGFTRISEKISAELLVSEVNLCFSAFDDIMEKYGIEKIKTIGDAYLCAGGLPELSYTHASDMLKASFEICRFMNRRKAEKEGRGEIPFEVRIGINSGPVVAGVVGVRKFAYDIWGDTVNIAARMEQNSEPGRINISGSTYNLVKDQFTFEYRGKIEAKNKGEVDMYYVTGEEV